MIKFPLCKKIILIKNLNQNLEINSKLRFNNIIFIKYIIISLY